MISLHLIHQPKYVIDQCIHSYFTLPNERFIYQIFNNLNFSQITVQNILITSEVTKVSKTSLSHNISYRIISSIIRILIWKIIDKII